MPAVTKLIKLNTQRLKWNFALTAERHWFNGSPALTHLLNAYTLLVPDNESYYIRTIQRFVPQLEDDSLKAEVMSFIHQESMHGVAHRAYWKCLSARGIKINRYTTCVNVLLYRILEPIQPLRLRLSVVAAIEHINAFLANIFLSLNLLENADPELRKLFTWHFSEEIQHKAVAHDVLKRFYPGYVTRVAGAVFAFPLFCALIAVGTAYLLSQDGQLFRRRHYLEIRDLFRNHGVGKACLYQMGRYFRPSFSPWEIDDSKLMLRGIAIEQDAIEFPVRDGAVGSKGGLR